MTAAEREDELDLLALLRVAIGYRVLIGSITVLCAVIAAVWALTMTPIYRSEVVLTEVGDQGLGAGGGMAGQLGGLATLAGIKLGAAEAAQRARATLQSRGLVEEFIKRNALLPKLFLRGEQSPTLWRAVKKFKTSVLSIKEDNRRGTITVAINWSDPREAARWANDFVALANEVLRTHAVEESRRNIEYLDRQISGTNVVEMQKVMYNLIESETKTLMLASGRLEYSFTVVDPAVAPEIRVKPQRTLMVLIGILFGLLIGILAAFGHRAVLAARGPRPSHA